MPTYDLVCDVGHAFEAVRRVADRYAPCVVCGGTVRQVYRSHSVNGDEIPGGFVQENFGDQPETFYSKSAMAKRAKELGLEPFVRWAGEHDQHVTRWDAPSAYTLEAAAAMLARGAVSGTDPDVRCDTLSLTVREVKGWPSES